jgi:hypothetical protein
MLTYERLKSMDIKVDLFADNNESKHGKLIKNKVLCVTFDELAKIKDDTLVIVANKYPSEIVNQLNEAGFPYITTKQDFDHILN